MFGMNENQVRKIVREEIKKELASQAVTKLFASVNPKELLEDLLSSRGVSLVGLIRSCVQEELARENYVPDASEIKEEAVNAVTEEITDGLDYDELYQVLGEKVLDRLQKKEP